jgi:hypothetical protein
VCLRPGRSIRPTTNVTTRMLATRSPPEVTPSATVLALARPPHRPLCPWPSQSTHPLPLTSPPPLPAQKYGPLVCLLQTHVSSATPSSPATIYAHGTSALPKGPFYRYFDVGGAPSLFSTQGRALAHPFSLACVCAYEAWVRCSPALNAQCVAAHTQE